MTSFLGGPIDAAYHLVAGLTTGLTPLLGGLAAVAAIILFTIAVRLLLMPLSLRAMRGMAAQARIAPQVRALRAKHGKQPERLQAEMAELYRREGVSVLAGIGPMLLQWPVFSVLYLLFRESRISGAPNLLLGRRLLGVPLGGHWLSSPGIVSVHGLVFLGVLALLAAACWLLTRVVRKMAAAQAEAVSVPAPGGAIGVITRVGPYVSVVIAVFVPLAAAIYLVTSTSWSAAERYLLRRRAAGR
jgi:YidC/Oxa1 family membrane protein insertase